MKRTLTHHLLETHAVVGEVESGGEIGLKIDQTLTQDATGTLVHLAFENAWNAANPSGTGGELSTSRCLASGVCMSTAAFGRMSRARM